MEREYKHFRLAEGCEEIVKYNTDVVWGPYVSSPMFGEGECEIGITITNLDSEKHYRTREMARNSRKRAVIVKIQIPRKRHSVRPPEFKVLLKEAWTKELLDRTIRSLRQSEISKAAVEYIVARLARIVFDRKKVLNLPKGLKLIGELEFETVSSPGCIAEQDLVVHGRIGKTLETAKKTNIVTVKYLYPHHWPGSDKNPGYRRNTEIWSRKLETLAIAYLKEIVNFADDPMDKQIRRVISRLTSRTDWAKVTNAYLQKLRALGNHEDDPRLKQAFGLIDEVHQEATA